MPGPRRGQNDPVEIGRRIRAAQTLGGFDSVEDLAEAINAAGMSAKTIRRMIDPEYPRKPESYELVAIARACNIPESFFTGDFGFVDEQTELQTIHQDVAALSTQINEQYHSVRSTINEPGRNLAEMRLHERLNTLERRFDEMIANQRALLTAAERLQESFLQATPTTEQLAQEAEAIQWPGDPEPEQHKRETGT